MKLIKFVTISFLVLFCMTSAVFSTHIDVASDYDFKLALDYVFYNQIDSVVLTTSGGVYTTSDTVPMLISDPLTITAAPGLAEKPVFTHSDPDSNVLAMFIICDDITFDGIVFDGGHELTHGLKYAMRFRHTEEDFPGGQQFAKIGTNITIRNCDFRNIFRDKETVPEMAAGHALYFMRPQGAGDPLIKAGNVIIENCTFANIGDEAIRLTETEKYAIDRVVDTLIVRNCTFTNIDAECIRFYADTDETTEDAYVLLEKLTINNSATRVCYVKNNWGTIFRDVIISNSRMPGISRSDRTDFLVQIQRPGSRICCVDTFNITTLDGTDFGTEIYVSKNQGEGVDELTIYGYDPEYSDPSNLDYTLQASSPAYFGASDGGALGDLRWAANTPTRIGFDYSIVGSGIIEFDPVIKGRSFMPNEVVTVTAVPDSTWEFVEWSGDLTGSENPKTITVDAEKSITATFQEATGVDESDVIAFDYRLDQNYPNPFNPSTTISFSLKKTGLAKLEIYNLLGQKVLTVFEEKLKSGNHKILLDSTALSSGVYFYKLTAGNYNSIKKMVLMR